MDLEMEIIERDHYQMHTEKDENTQIARIHNTQAIDHARISFLEKLTDSTINKQTLNQVSVQGNIEDIDPLDETVNHLETENFIPLTSTDKERIYKNWSNALIVKILGRRVGYRFLQQKFIAIWKPTENLSLIDLGFDYYLVKFTKEDNYNKALHGGTWFIGSQFLTVRIWEPRFVASQA